MPFMRKMPMLNAVLTSFLWFIVKANITFFRDIAPLDVYIYKPCYREASITTQMLPRQDRNVYCHKGAAVCITRLLQPDFFFSFCFSFYLLFNPQDLQWTGMNSQYNIRSPLNILSTIRLFPAEGHVEVIQRGCFKLYNWVHRNH